MSRKLPNYFAFSIFILYFCICKVKIYENPFDINKL